MPNTLTTSGSLTPKQTVHKSVGGTFHPTGAALVLKVFLMTSLSHTLTLSGNLIQAFGRGVVTGGTGVFSGVLNKIAGIANGIGGALVTAGTQLRLQPGKALDAELTTSGSLTPLKLFNIPGLAGTLALAGTLRNTLGRAFSGTLTLAGNLSRGFGKTFSGVLTFVGGLGIARSTGDVGTCTITAGDLIARIYERLDGDEQYYYTLAEASHAIDVAQRLFAWITLCIEHRFVFTLTAGEAFPSIRTQIVDFWVPLRVSLASGERLLPVTLDDLDKFNSNWQSTPGVPRYYAQMGFNLMAVYPQPTGTTTLHITYAAEPFNGFLQLSSDVAPLIVDGAIWMLRLKEGGPEVLQSTMENLDRFVKGAQRYRTYIAARSKAQLYDSVPHELTDYDLSRFLFRPPKKQKGQ